MAWPSGSLHSLGHCILVATTFAIIDCLQSSNDKSHKMTALSPVLCRRKLGARLFALFVLSAVLLLGCEMPFGLGSDDGNSAPDPELRDQAEIGPGLVARLYAPEQVATGDPFQVRFTAENTTQDSIQVKTGACWGRPGAIFDEEQVPLVGSAQVCTLQLLTWTLSGKETRERTFDLKASLNASSGSPEVEGPAEPGTYTLQTTLDWTVSGREVEKNLEADVEIVGQE